MRVADFGCGSGFFAIPMAERAGRNGKMFAVDIQQSSLESVRSRARAKNLNNITLIWADLELPGASKIDETSIDLVLVTNILFQSENKKNILQEARHILKPKGKLAVIEWKEDTPLGPPRNFRIAKSALLNMIRNMEFSLEKEIDLGPTHYGLILIRQ